MEPTSVAVLSNASLLCELVSFALQREEIELSQITSSATHKSVDPKLFLTSVAHAPELAIGYLVRKEALRRNVAIESEHTYTDLCLLNEGAYTASLELKCWEVWRTGTKTLQEDVQKVLAQSTPVLAASERYHGWILVFDGEYELDAAEQFVRKTLAGIAELGEHVVSAPIPINRTEEAMQIHHGHRYHFIQVVVFSAIKPHPGPGAVASRPY
jgi:hypothetical protein